MCKSEHCTGIPHNKRQQFPVGEMGRSLKVLNLSKQQKMTKKIIGVSWQGQDQKSNTAITFIYGTETY